jgi:hypothetical protein
LEPQKPPLKFISFPYKTSQAIFASVPGEIKGESMEVLESEGVWAACGMCGGEAQAAAAAAVLTRGAGADAGADAEGRC